MSKTKTPEPANPVAAMRDLLMTQIQETMKLMKNTTMKPEHTIRLLRALTDAVKAYNELGRSESGEPLEQIDVNELIKKAPKRIQRKFAEVRRRARGTKR
jgi:hypothetical protein